MDWSPSAFLAAWAIANVAVAVGIAVPWWLCGRAHRRRHAHLSDAEYFNWFPPFGA